MAGDALDLLDHLGIADPSESPGTRSADGSPKPSSSSIPSGYAPPPSWEAPTGQPRGRRPSQPWSAIWPRRGRVPRLYDALETIRYLPYQDLQDDDVIDGWLALISDIEEWPNPGRLGQYEAALAWSTDPIRTVAWPTITVPCLVMGFEYDIDSPPARAREAAEMIPGAEYAEIAGASHLGFFTHARPVAEVLIDYFARH